MKTPSPFKNEQSSSEMERLMENELIRNEKPLTNGNETLAIGNEMLEMKNQ